MQNQESCLKINDNLYIFASQRKDQAGVSISLFNQLPTPDLFDNTKNYGFHIQDHLVILYYEDEDNIIGTLKVIEINGASLYNLMATDWKETAPQIWDHYKRAKITYDSEGRPQINFSKPEEAP